MLKPVKLYRITQGLKKKKTIVVVIVVGIFFTEN